MAAPSPELLQQEDHERSKVKLQEGPAEGGPEQPGHGAESCCDQSIGRLVDFKCRQDFTEERPDHGLLGVLPCGPVGPQTHLEATFQDLKQETFSFVERELKQYWNVLSANNMETDEEVVTGGESEEQWSNREAFQKITESHLRMMEQHDLAELLGNKRRVGVSRRDLQRSLKQKVQFVFEGIAKVGNAVPLHQIYTDLYVTEGDTTQVNEEHEVLRIETASRKSSRPERNIRQEDLFRSSPGGHVPRCVLTKGVAGIGKTLLTQKLILDWAEDKAHQNFQLILPFTFRELNVLKEKKLSLVELVHRFFPQTKESGLSSFEKVEVLLIFDGLDECRLPLDFSSQVLTAATESASVDVLLTNLIRGDLLPSARIWLTTRPAAANQIPVEYVDMVTEVRGFTDPQKEEYFRKRFTDEEQICNIISHIKSSRSLYIMCHMPIFCWITATVLEDMLKKRETEELPKTLTEMYIHFLVVQSKVKKLKYNGVAGTDTVWDPESRKMIESLGKLAFKQLQRGNVIFYVSDLAECDMDGEAASKYSGVFTQIFREEKGLYQDTVYCFVHLSVQEFFAAFHVHQTFFSSGVNLLAPNNIVLWTNYLGLKPKPDDFYLTAIVETLKSRNGHLDLFLRFLLGLSLQENQTLLRGLLDEHCSWTKENSVELIKKKLNDNLCPDRIINLFHCLNEVRDGSLVEQVHQQLRSGAFSSSKLSPSLWSALAFILLSSNDTLEVFDINRYFASEEVLLRLLPVVKVSKTVKLKGCQMSKESFTQLCSILGSPSSTMTKLDLSNTNLKDSGVGLLCTDLKSPHCGLTSLRLRMCDLTETGCLPLSSVLRSSSSMLEELDLSFNKLEDAGIKFLSDGLKSPHCHLRNLKLSGCGLTMESCKLISSVFDSTSSLTQLDLSDNDLDNSGMDFLSLGLMKPNCHLEGLCLSGCLITAAGCLTLAEALDKNPTHLRQLDLSYNDPEGPGLKKLWAGLKRKDWSLETLRLDHIGQTESSSAPSTCQYL